MSQLLPPTTMEVSEDQIIKVESKTRNQHADPTWHMLRKGRLTASNFGAVLNAKRTDKPNPSLLRRVLGQYDLTGVKSINWGITHEQDAIKQFTEKSQFKVDKSGLWLHKCGYLGASPDGLIGSDFLIEVKCPYAWRNDSIDPDHVQDATGKSYLTRNSSSGKVELKTNHDYWHQIQVPVTFTDNLPLSILIKLQ